MKVMHDSGQHLSEEGLYELRSLWKWGSHGRLELVTLRLRNQARSSERSWRSGLEEEGDSGSKQPHGKKQ